MKTSAVSSWLWCLVLLATVVTAQVTNPALDPQEQSSDQGWRVFSPPDKSFSIELPGPPENTHDDVLSDEPWVGETYSSMDATPNIHFYSVDIVCANGRQPKNISLDAYLHDLMGAIRLSRHSVSIKKITVDGLEGRELVSFKLGDYSLVRWIIAGPRIYILSMISNSTSERFTPSVKRFLNSFHVNRPPSSSFPDCPKFEGRLPVATRGTIHFVEFPEYWMSSELGREEYLRAEWYEVRSAPGSSEREFLFGAMSHQDSGAEKQYEGWYSRNYYAVNLGSTVQIREVSKVEWLRARRVSHQPEKIVPQVSDETMPAIFAYQGRAYAKTSEHWGSAIVSPNRRWVAVYSYSGKKIPTSMWGGGLPHEGDAYWDVYDTKSGEKILAWTARFVHNPGTLDLGAVWVGDEYLVMPFDTALQSCVIGVLPRN